MQRMSLCNKKVVVDWFGEGGVGDGGGGLGDGGGGLGYGGGCLHGGKGYEGEQLWYQKGLRVVYLYALIKIW